MLWYFSRIIHFIYRSLPAVWFSENWLGWTRLNLYQRFSYLPFSHRSLVWFSLYNCDSVDNEEVLLKLIPHFTTLVHIDLSKKPSSQDSAELERIPYPIVTGRIMTALAKLPKLISLDISGQFFFVFCCYLMNNLFFVVFPCYHSFH